MLDHQFLWFFLLSHIQRPSLLLNSRRKMRILWPRGALVENAMCLKCLIIEFGYTVNVKLQTVLKACCKIGGGN